MKYFYNINVLVSTNWSGHCNKYDVVDQIRHSTDGTNVHSPHMYTLYMNQHTLLPLPRFYCLRTHHLLVFSLVCFECLFEREREREVGKGHCWPFSLSLDSITRWSGLSSLIRPSSCSFPFVARTEQDL